MEDNLKETTRPLGALPLPTRQIVNTDTGASDLYVETAGGVFGRTIVAKGNAIGDKWTLYPEFVRRYNIRNGTNLTPKEFESLFNKDLKPILNKDRADIINKHSPYNTRTYLSRTAKLPGVIDPVDNTKPGADGQRIPADEPIPPETPAPAAASGFNEDQQKDTEKAFAKGVGIPSYESVRYPEYLQLDHQDCIQFSILEYNPRGLSLEKSPERRRLDGKSPIATITLPIPSGISDSNQVDWQKDDLDLATQGIADVVINAVAEGSAAAGDAASKNLNTLLNAEGKKTLEAIVAVKSAQALLGTNVLSRKYGGVLNPNSELLFSGPQLRTFSFTFRMYPRSSSEAILVRKIIRYFKQAMSVQRGESILVLKAPHTFGIKYLTSSKNEHPYLNKFKECALTQCNVNYTPDGTYMTYAGDEPSMTAYELQLQFQELEPIFNDDYGNEDTQIGY
jgi:hypothetical protein